MNDLLQVLDMSEEEQWKWVSKQWQKFSIDPSWQTKEYQNMALADLAFRLRDETIEKDLDWDDALVLVWEKLGRSMKYQAFSKYYAQPIHWIIAASIAKGQ